MAKIRGLTQDEQDLIQYLDEVLKDAAQTPFFVQIYPQPKPMVQVFIEYRDGTKSQPIGIQDCVEVNKTIQEPLEGWLKSRKLFEQGYDLEVSSPGLHRPIWRKSDFQRFSGERARIHLAKQVFELGEQKKFVGKILGYQEDRILFELDENSVQPHREITIPYESVLGAQLEGKFS